MPERPEILHLPVDVQTIFYNDLGPQRREEFPRKIDGFCRDLKNIGIESLPVAYENEFVRAGFYKPPYRDKEGGRILDALSFGPAYYPQDSAQIYVKAFNDTFAEYHLTDELRRRGTKVLLISGIHTKYCIAQTIEGAFEECAKDVCIKVVYDMLADATSGQAILPEDDPKSHKDYLQYHFSKLDRKRLQFVTSEEVLSEYGQTAPRPQTSAKRSAASHDR
ncbi:MAG: isochorismatase family protein [Alphaproteobacteria bacterium]|nr:isochorismatase family protein [Alphaproteobacteria bacterium]